MRRHAILLAYMLMAAAPVLAQKQLLGIFSTWGAFVEMAPHKCFAVAEPVNQPQTPGSRPSASISFWPDRGARMQFYARLSHDKRTGSAVILKIDGRSFQLIASERASSRDAWAANARTDLAIVSALRGGINMAIETRAKNGRLVRDVYPLRGAASAIDAAAIACSGRNALEKPDNPA